MVMLYTDSNLQVIGRFANGQRQQQGRLGRASSLMGMFGCPTRSKMPDCFGSQHHQRTHIVPGCMRLQSVSHRPEAGLRERKGRKGLIYWVTVMAFRDC